MKPSLLLCALLAPLPAAAQYYDPNTGARPGNVPGTNNSLPTSSAASNGASADTRSVIAPRLPRPLAGDDNSPRQFLLDARAALAANRTGEAQEALERAETRMLDRSTPQGVVDEPSRNRLVDDITQARRSIANRDFGNALRIMDSLLANPAFGPHPPGQPPAPPPLRPPYAAPSAAGY